MHMKITERKNVQMCKPKKTMMRTAFVLTGLKLDSPNYLKQTKIIYKMARVNHVFYLATNQTSTTFWYKQYTVVF